MDLNEMRARYEREEGYSCLNATARVCQDVILSKLAASGMRDRVTVVSATVKTTNFAIAL